MPRCGPCEGFSVLTSRVVLFVLMAGIALFSLLMPSARPRPDDAVWEARRQIAKDQAIRAKPARAEFAA